MESSEKLLEYCKLVQHFVDEEQAASAGNISAELAYLRVRSQLSTIVQIPWHALGINRRTGCIAPSSAIPERTSEPVELHRRRRANNSIESARADVQN